MEEIILTPYSRDLWWRRENERRVWMESPKVRRREKKVKKFGNVEVDIELYPALTILNEYGITTEYSCSGVSVLDEPEDHSLYAYVTLPKTTASDHFIKYLIQRMGRRMIVTEEPKRQRYDISSFFIKHNRSFCLLLYYYSLEYIQLILTYNRNESKVELN